ncbi:MAG: hypothetical protein A2268_17125 [Candidatus Raymondbacteria bacterium RifOxyA12_full_50_37]|uniref:Calcineurin-like phosphoesterase domain-containing protein n=1 Tax=Candidatus Raymondbacteria bacterium RIFOXYD12_FULL_49_13 TaxID=1817890 RepID=A0A1F7FCV7_UNCRA|nr:MAG: hypothetical protein A2268_17125 [Candidatus Raymondbacteria bacterium RifOxyA12_full_50_37]OGJ87129.1 MAG: hypothetical protein A2248_19195 [Candidatus Raymondbacteria bacterium RIFOXYA2_FULL_49_16]OGJ94805.1 MAG: hypothetical protein A2350_20170 [Candidatus Raymondbacteria bacterium RifOxyB12_full_50_8]OGJ96524.1 MAG: hypothetical protein A2453_03200 [Candidatus Raymondbacteria bacterium RIFOXYC2_FULL_50_21]OGK04478.1 MAG: hypothetical protein A2519_08155 [Candidatus Raymondbacteria b
MLRTKSFFVSDAHFGALYFTKGHPGPRAFVRFCKEITSEARTLYLVGDMFDFWFEFGAVVPKEHFRELCALRSLVDAGIRVVYVGGNHDFWYGDFMENEVGIEVHFTPITETIDTKRVLIHHGNGLLKRDVSQVVFKGLLRSRLNARLYRLIHPTLGLYLAKKISSLSRGFVSNPKNTEEVKAKYRAAAKVLFEKENLDAIVVAHTHYADLADFNGKTYVNTGNWLRDYDYTILENGQFTMHRFTIE